MSGLLADLYSAGDRMKRKLGGLLSDPAGTIALGSTRMAEDTNLLSRLASEAGYMPRTVNRADQSVLVGPEQKALARALLADKGAEMGMAGMTNPLQPSRGPAASAEWAGTNTPARRGESYADDMMTLVKQDLALKDFDPAMVRQGLIEWSQSAGIHPGHSLRAFMRQLNADQSIPPARKQKILSSLAGQP